MAAEKVRTMMLLDQLLDRRHDSRPKLERRQPAPRDHVKNEVADATSRLIPVEKFGRTHRRDEFGESVSYEMVLVRTLLGDDCLNEHPESLLVAAPFCVDQVDQEVGSRHYAPTFRTSRLYETRA
jgi:hypothetical protein